MFVLAKYAASSFSNRFIISYVTAVPPSNRGNADSGKVMDREKFPLLVRQLYSIVDELEQMFPGRHFTPDGHLVGSLGEELVSHHYGLELLTASNKGFDAIKDGRHIEIKATQGKSAAFRHEPKHAIVIRLNKDGSFTEIYNGPGHLIWSLVKHKPLPSNGQYGVSLSKLQKLMEQVPAEARLDRVKKITGSESAARAD